MLRRWLADSLEAFGLPARCLHWSGLRAGGATEFWLRRENLPALRRRGRWSNERTLERYVQEGVVAQFALQVPDPVSRTLARLSELSPAIFSEPGEDFSLEVVEAPAPATPTASSASSSA